MKEQKPNRSQLLKEERIDKILRIAARIKLTFQANRDVDKEKLISVCMMDFGLSRRTALEYLQAIKSRLGFEEENGIYKRKGYKSQKKLDIAA